MKTKVLFLGMALALLALVGVATATSIRAEDIGNYSPIIQKLVERFNLNPQEVQEVFNQERQERHQERLARFEENLDQAVADGKITQEQKELILAKKEEMRARHEEVKNLSWEERRAAMDQEREEMKAWAEENEIDFTQLCLFGPGPHFGGHFGPGRGE